MTINKEEARDRIAALVERWQSLTAGERRRYNEENTKKDFVLPLFEALGWNVKDAAEVAAEHAAAPGRVDYAFRLRGVSRFYVEAKALRDDLAGHPAWVKQAVSYAYNKGIHWVVLTNFNDLWVFSGDVQPHRFLTLTADKYVDDFETLWLLSKEATEAGLLEQLAAKHGVFPPRVAVEKRLYEQLSRWRRDLFNELHSYRKDLPLPIVDETVQRLFNRLVFIRTCEDRNLEEPVLLPLVRQYQDRTLKGSLLQNLGKVFADFERAYDSELFAFHVLDQVHFDDPTLEEVIRGLYGPPGGLVEYDFSLIDADVLGRVYEQYLGHVAQVVRQRHKEVQMRLDRGFSPDRAIEEAIDVIERPQRRKAQGIYYTPRWVVDYIVRETVGRFIEENKNRPDAIHEMRILDPACGSGSFLIRAYDELLRYHMGTRPPEWVFSDERLAILRNNIYGVDIDTQAVEIARLNLLLRALREQQLLPELAGNICRGNSLISGGEAELKPYFGDGWREKHPFNWEKEFPKVMAEGGFDVVIGNPPYVRVDSLEKDEKAYYGDHYCSATGKYDAYYLFLELALKLTKDEGVFAFITPNRFCTNTTGERLRKLLLAESQQVSITSVSRIPVFEEAANYPVITIVRKKGKEKGKLFYFEPVEFSEPSLTTPAYKLVTEDLSLLPRSIIPINVNEVQLKLALKVLRNYTLAGCILEIQEGLRIPLSFEKHKLSKKDGVPIIKQFQFSRYSEIQEYRYLANEDRKTLFSEDAKRIVNSKKPKLVFAEDALRIEATLDEYEGLCQGGVYFATKNPHVLYDLKYLLALYNSKLLTFVFKSLYAGIHMGGGYLRFRTQYLGELPIKEIDLANSEDKQTHDVIVGKVEEMLELQEKLAPIRQMPTSERDDLLREIERVDREIDGLVYELYGLSESERRLVEEG